MEDELVEYRELTDNKIATLHAVKKDQLDEEIQKCADKDYTINLGNKLKDILTLKDLTPNILHSLVEKITCEQDGSVQCIKSNSVNPFQEK